MNDDCTFAALARDPGMRRIGADDITATRWASVSGCGWRRGASSTGTVVAASGYAWKRGRMRALTIDQA